MRVVKFSPLASPWKVSTCTNINYSSPTTFVFLFFFLLKLHILSVYTKTRICFTMHQIYLHTLCFGADWEGISSYNICHDFRWPTECCSKDLAKSWVFFWREGGREGRVAAYLVSCNSGARPRIHIVRSLCTQNNVWETSSL